MSNSKEGKNWLEWTVTIISSILVLFIIGFLISQIIWSEDTPPEIEVTLGEVTYLSDYYAIPITAKNLGTKTAQKVRIEIKQPKNINTEKGFIEFDYLPGKSSVNGWVNFSEKPDAASLIIHVLGYSTP